MSEGARAFSVSRFRTALLHFVAGRAAQAAAMIAFTFVAVRLLSEHEFAAYMLAFGLIEAGRPLVSLGLVPMLQQFLPDLALHSTSADIRRFARWALVARVLMTLLLAAFCLLGWSSLLLWLGVSPSDAPPAALICAVVASSLMADYSVTTLEALMHQRVAQPLRTALPLGKLVALGALFGLGALELSHLLWAEFLLAMLSAVVGELLVRRAIGALNPDGSRQAQWRSMLAFAWHMSGAQLLATAANPGVVRVTAARVLGIEVLAQFAFLQQLALYVTRFMPSTQFASVLRPMLVARQTSGQADTVAAAVGFLWKINLLVGLGLLVPALVGGDVLAAWLYGRPLASGGLALPLMLAVPAFVAQENLASTVLQLHRNTQVVRRLNALALTVPVTVLLGGQGFGLPGAAAGLVIGIGLQSVVTSWVTRARTGGLRLDASGLARALLAAIVATGVGLIHIVAPDSPIWTGPIAAGLSLVLYAALLLVARPFNEAELTLVQRLAPRGARLMRGFARPHRHRDDEPGD